ncbi:YifB family Mg chelatase-like AAA ATPase [Candidatus Microgenomates bacterium]|nr:YifB family Mg chelatase-like AAA ATPase [Candidatus Microgenomates bacterium]
MALAKLYSAAVTGLDAEPVEIEIDITRGKVLFILVGLPDKVVEESKERVRSAIKNSGGHFPQERLTINLAPADLRKEGPVFDLGIALGILQASGQIRFDATKTIILGELSLDGKLRRVSGVLPIAEMAVKRGFDTMLVPKENFFEANIIPGLKIVAGESLADFIHYFAGHNNIKAEESGQRIELEDEETAYQYDFAYIKGQNQAKRALEIAAAGGHNVLMSGPPGSGKTLLARSFPSVLPRMALSEALEVTKIYSVAGILPPGEALIKKRPFRSPHHTTSAVAIVGGGTHPRPGEISLAHRGVLFLDEFPEFPRFVLEVLRQPLEDGLINVSRASGSATYPAKFTLLAAQNPCPCGYLTDPTKPCVCSSSTISRYQKKISGPLLDRIDLHIEVPRVEYQQLAEKKIAEESSVIRARVQKARDIQAERFIVLTKKIVSNGEMGSAEITRFCALTEPATMLLKNAVNQMHLSARGYHRVLKLARTIADLDGAEIVDQKHIAEALQYRSREKG